jgi:hypothetical protein
MSQRENTQSLTQHPKKVSDALAGGVSKERERGKKGRRRGREGLERVGRKVKERAARAVVVAVASWPHSALSKGLSN